jgi:hypothetical protein
MMATSAIVANKMVWRQQISRSRSGGVTAGHPRTRDATLPGDWRDLLLILHVLSRPSIVISACFLITEINEFNLFAIYIHLQRRWLAVSASLLSF